MDKNTTILFVYGGLLKGMTLSPFIEGAKYLGPAYIKARIYFLGQFPGIVDGNDYVFGELYELNKEDLPGLDKIEDYHPGQEEISSYVRKQTEVFTLPDGLKIMAEAYFYNRPLEKNHILIPHGDYRKFIYEEEQDNYWFVTNKVSRSTINGVLNDIEKQIPVQEGILQLIDTKRTNGTIEFKKEKVQLLKLKKNQFKAIDEFCQNSQDCLSVSVPFTDKKGNIDVAITVFNLLYS